jgi:hypothetical protein
MSEQIQKRKVSLTLLRLPNHRSQERKVSLSTRVYRHVCSQVTKLPAVVDVVSSDRC